jgi:hypothetical protein
MRNEEELRMLLTTFIGAFLGALLSLLISIYIEYQRKPKLYFTIEEPIFDASYPSAPARDARFLRVQLWNRAMPKFLKWLNREAALHCSGDIQFHHIEDGAPIFTRSRPIRWAGSEEPLSFQVLQDGRVVQLFDPGKYSAASRRNCFPGDKETIDVVARFDDDEECFGWSNENYLPGKGWRNDDWKLPGGRFLVKVTVYSSGEKIVGVFKLENSVGRKDFRLMEASVEDVRKLNL